MQKREEFKSFSATTADLKAEEEEEDHDLEFSFVPVAPKVQTRYPVFGRSLLNGEEDDGVERGRHSLGDHFKEEDEKKVSFSSSTSTGSSSLFESHGFFSESSCNSSKDVGKKKNGIGWKMANFVRQCSKRRLKDFVIGKFKFASRCYCGMER